MRLNWETALVGERVVLVPYRRKFVRRYHEWMKDPFLQEMTASEPLTLEEEYAMQASWRDDPKKCTFIVLDRSLPGADAFATTAMAGDVNLFLNDPDGDRGVAELEMMVAEAACRRKGLGREAVRMMMRYGVEALGTHRFYCKINEANAPSIAMFEGLGFARVNYVKAFREIEFQFRVPKPPQQEDTTAPAPAGGALEEEDDERWNEYAAAAAAVDWAARWARLRDGVVMERVGYVESEEGDEGEEEKA